MKLLYSLSPALFTSIHRNNNKKQTDCHICEGKGVWQYSRCAPLWSYLLSFFFSRLLWLHCSFFPLSSLLFILKPNNDNKKTFFLLFACNLLISTLVFLFFFFLRLWGSLCRFTYKETGDTHASKKKGNNEKRKQRREKEAQTPFSFPFNQVLYVLILYIGFIVLILFLHFFLLFVLLVGVRDPRGKRHPPSQKLKRSSRKTQLY